MNHEGAEGTEGEKKRTKISADALEVAHGVIGAAIEVHRVFGPGFLKEARAAWFSRYRLLQVSATHSEAALPIALVEECFGVRRRMLETLDYNLDDDADAVVRLNAIRLGSGHLDLANDLLAVADSYRERRDTIENDRKNYRKTGEAHARRLADKILRLLGAVTTPE